MNRPRGLFFKMQTERSRTRSYTPVIWGGPCHPEKFGGTIVLITGQYTVMSGECLGYLSWYRFGDHFVSTSYTAPFKNAEQAVSSQVNEMCIPHGMRLVTMQRRECTRVFPSLRQHRETLSATQRQTLLRFQLITRGGKRTEAPIRDGLRRARGTDPLYSAVLPSLAPLCHSLRGEC